MFKTLFKIIFISCILFSVLGCTQETDDKTVQMMALSRSVDMNSVEESELEKFKKIAEQKEKECIENDTYFLSVSDHTLGNRCLVSIKQNGHSVYWSEEIFCPVSSISQELRISNSNKTIDIFFYFENGDNYHVTVTVPCHLLVFDIIDYKLIITKYDFTTETYDLLKS